MSHSTSGKPSGRCQATDFSPQYGGFTLKRIDFAIGEGPCTDLSMVANEIQVKSFKSTSVERKAP